MKTSAFRLVGALACTACLSLALPSPAHAGRMDGIMSLVAVTQMKASNANDDAMSGAEKQRKLAVQRQQLLASAGYLEGAGAPAAPDPSVARASRIVADVEAVAAFGSTAQSDGIDDAERKQLGDLVSVARKDVDDAIADATTQMTDAKKRLKTATDGDEQVRLKELVKSLRVTVKAHKQTAGALRALAKRLAA